MNSINIIHFIPFLSGLAFIIIGFILKCFPPKKINYFYGYRTPPSMRNQKNWDFSQSFSGKQLIISGLTLLIINLLAYFLNNSWIRLPIFNAIIIFSAALYVIIITEIGIKKNNS